jgi:choline dehydrogenase
MAAGKDAQRLDNREVFDYVIVGGGSAGAVIGARLSEEATRSVLVLEAGAAGPLDTDAELLSNVSFALTTRDWGMRARVTGTRELDYPQGKFVGGGSSVNGGLALRGVPGDYDGWAEEGNPLWSWDHMLPCFRRLEHDGDFAEDVAVHGSSGPVPIVRWRRNELLAVQEAFAEACTDAGIPWTSDHNHPDSTGIGPLPMNRAGGRRMSTALTYLVPARARSNLTVRGGAHVHRVQIDKGRATGLVVEQDGDVGVVEAGEVILSAGAIHSPAILWRSGIGPSDELTRLGIRCVVDNPAVGANLTDHPGLFHFLHPGRHAPDLGAPQFQLGARCSSGAGEVANDLLLSMMNFWDLTGSPDFQSVVGAPVVVVLTCGVHQPRSRGRVVLATQDPWGRPLIDLNLLDERADLERLVEALRRCHDLARSPAMRDFVGASPVLDDADFDDDVVLERYARDFVAPWYHAVGTCRMGVGTRPGNVVDEHLRVHGIEGLRVVDASIMPTIVRSPTNLTAIAIAEHAAEIIRDE